MGFVEIKEWLDEVVDHLDELKAREQLNSLISLNFGHFTPDTILVHKGIDIMAAAIGEPLCFMKTRCNIYDFVAYFVYRGYCVKQYAKVGELDVC